jgi:glucose-fructose oxidoreductase
MATRRSRRIRYAVIGLGHIAQGAVLPAFAHTRRSALTALVSGDPRKLDALGERYQVAHRFTYDDLDACFRWVDAVMICTPNTAHARPAVAAARAGVHVLCEKPLATSEAECAEMIRARDQGGVQMMTAYRLHFDPLTLEVIDHVRSGRLGEPRYIASAFSMHATPGGIRTRPETGGGSVYDLGIYCINAARMLFDAEPIRVSGDVVRGERSGMPDVDETTSALLHFEGDRLAMFTSSFDAAPVSVLRVVGTEGSIVMDPAYEYAEALGYEMTIGERTTRKKGRKRDQFAAEIDYFSECIQSGRPPEPSAEEGAWDVRVINAILESARRGATVTLPSFVETSPSGDQAISRPPARRRPPLIGVSAPHEE